MYELKINKDLRNILDKCKADTNHLDIDMDLSYDSVQNYIDDVDFYFMGYTEDGNDRNIEQSKEDLDYYYQTIKKTNPKEYKRQVKSHKELMFEYKETKKHLTELKRLYKKIKLKA
jgi:competence transcription factor ComK